MDDDPCQEDEPAEDVNQNIAESRGYGGWFAAQPDQERRGNRHEFPEHVKGEEVPGKCHSERAAHVSQSADVLGDVVDMEGVDHAHQGHD